MGLLDGLNKVVDSATRTVQDKGEQLSKSVDAMTSDADNGNVLQGMLGNYSSQDAKKIMAKWGDFLVDSEEIVSGYKLVRDELILTNYRIIFIDVQGVTGQKKAITQIYLDSIVDVKYTAAGFGFDDTDMYITYMANPFKKSLQTTLEFHHFEFPKKQDVTDLYRFLMQLAIENRIKINQ